VSITPRVSAECNDDAPPVIFVVEAGYGPYWNPGTWTEWVGVPGQSTSFGPIESQIFGTFERVDYFGGKASIHSEATMNPQVDSYRAQVQGQVQIYALLDSPDSVEVTWTVHEEVQANWIGEDDDCNGWAYAGAWSVSVTAGGQNPSASDV